MAELKRVAQRLGLWVPLTPRDEFERTRQELLEQEHRLAALHARVNVEGRRHHGEDRAPC